MDALANQKLYTTDYILSLPDGHRAELLDGVVYNMTPPKRIHQKLVSYFVSVISTHINLRNGDCEVYPAPFAVFLNADNKTYVEPDISVICDKSKLTDDGCAGAPNWIIEVVSPSSKHMDYILKLFKYRSAGVGEYWVVDPMDKSVTVYDFLNEDGGKYTFSDIIAVKSIDGLEIDFTAIKTDA